MISKTKIFFDGNCIVCDMEISHYKKIMPEAFELVDISSEAFRASEFKLTKEDVDKNLHVMTPEGEIKIGVDAFSHIWSLIPKYKWGSTAVSLPVVSLLAKIGYKGFTVVRPFLPKKNRH